MNKLKWAMQTALAAQFQKYRFGGDDPLEGYDCSGLIIEILQSVGKLPLKGDWTAAGLYHQLADLEVPAPKEGCLVFVCGLNTEPYHVEFCLDEEHSIGASGGDSTTVDFQAAVKQNAYVKIRPIRRFNAPLRFVDPFKFER